MITRNAYNNTKGYNKIINGDKNILHKLLKNNFFPYKNKVKQIYFFNFYIL